MTESIHTTYHSYENIHVKAWWVNDTLHRVDGPAMIMYFKDGRIYEELWYKNGNLHRVDGPASILHNNPHLIETQSWYINKIYISDEIWIWLYDNNIFAPFSDEDVMAIILRWG